MSHTNNKEVERIEEMERLIAEEIPIEDGGFVNYADAERYANTGYDMELIVKRFKEILHHQLQKARHDWLREEIVKLEGMKRELHSDGYIESAIDALADEEYNKALQTIIDRYQAELDQDNK